MYNKDRLMLTSICFKSIVKLADIIILTDKEITDLGGYQYKDTEVLSFLNTACL